MTVCILGGTGFVGKHLCQLLHNENVKTIVISRAPDNEFLRKYAPSIDGYAIGEIDLWEKLKLVTTLVILASGSRPASSWRSPESEIEHNLLPISTFLRRFIDINPNCHIIFASSGGQIYGNGYFEPISENSSPFPVTAYGFGKLLIEQLLFFFGNLDNVTYTVLRIANPVGYWQYGVRHGFVTAAISAGLSSSPLILYGDGKNIRDYFDVDDLCKLINIIISQEKKEKLVFNVGSGISFTELDIIKFVEKILRCNIDIEERPQREFDLKYSALDVSRIRNLVGWKTTTSIEETIQKIINKINNTSGAWPSRSRDAN